MVIIKLIFSLLILIVMAIPGQCTELSGVKRGFMPIVVVTKAEAGFNPSVNLIKNQQSKPINSSRNSFTYDELMKFGQPAYNQYCAACHQANGEGNPPVYPALKGSSVAVGNPISRHIDIVLNGIAGTAMQAFGNQLTDLQLAAIITYERNAWENNTGDVVQPKDVSAERQRLQQQN